MQDKITFRLLTSKDTDLMYNWLMEEHVHEWFASAVNISMDFVKSRFTEINDFIKRWVFQINGIDIGYIQNFFYEEDDGISLKYRNDIEAKEGSVGIDYFIGDKNYVHKGYGKIILKHFLDEIIFPDPRTKSIIVGPRTKNLASIKILEANGFKWYKNVIDDKGRDEYMMIRFP